MPISYPESVKSFWLKLSSQRDLEFGCRCRGDVSTLTRPGDMTFRPRTTFARKMCYWILSRYAKNGGAAQDRWTSVCMFVICMYLYVCVHDSSTRLCVAISSSYSIWIKKVALIDTTSRTTYKWSRTFTALWLSSWAVASPDSYWDGFDDKRYVIGLWTASPTVGSLFSF